MNHAYNAPKTYASCPTRAVNRYGRFQPCGVRLWELSLGEGSTGRPLCGCLGSSESVGAGTDFASKLIMLHNEVTILLCQVQ